MIISGLFQLLIVVLKFFLVALPAYEPPKSLGLSVLAAADFVLPLSELALVMGGVVAYLTASLAYTAVMRVLKLVRGAG